MFRLQYLKKKEQNMTRKNYFYGKRSEYRHNYLPFDFYDFWITAKENQNQRYKNKIRDYLHTPFDWDEDQDLYSRSISPFDTASSAYDSQAHQSTQTTHRSRAGNDQTNDCNNVNEKNSIIGKKFSNNQRPKSSISFQDEQKTTKKQFKNEDVDFYQEGKNQSKNEKDTKKIKSFEEKLVKTKNQKQEPIQTKFETKQKTIIQGKKRQRKNNKKPRLFKNEFQTNYLNNAPDRRNISNFDKVLARSISNMTIQTPQAWNLRDYKPKPSKASSKILITKYIDTNQLF